jgi:uncharacterized membrane protein YeaQ/YmgE (transglycosylase-associated protein family)
MSILWTIIIGFVAGVIAKFLHPGKNEPSGFILTTVLGIVGALLATYLGQAVGWYKAGESAGFIGATVGAIIILVVWGFFARRNALWKSPGWIDCARAAALSNLGIDALSFVIAFISLCGVALRQPKGDRACSEGRSRRTTCPLILSHLSCNS